MTKTVMIQLTEQEREIMIKALEKYESWLVEWEDRLEVAELITELEDLKAK